MYFFEPSVIESMFLSLVCFKLSQRCQKNVTAQTFIDDFEVTVFLESWNEYFLLLLFIIDIYIMIIKVCVKNLYTQNKVPFISQFLEI